MFAMKTVPLLHGRPLRGTASLEVPYASSMLRIVRSLPRTASLQEAVPAEAITTLTFVKKDKSMLRIVKRRKCFMKRSDCRKDIIHLLREKTSGPE